jgi:hypothetical protein
MWVEFLLFCTRVNQQAEFIGTLFSSSFIYNFFHLASRLKISKLLSPAALVRCRLLSDIMPRRCRLGLADGCGCTLLGCRGEVSPAGDGHGRKQRPHTRGRCPRLFCTRTDHNAAWPATTGAIHHGPPGLRFQLIEASICNSLPVLETMESRGITSW